MTTAAVIAACLLYVVVGAVVAVTLRSNYAALQKAGLVSHYDMTAESAVIGGIFWPFVGLALLVMHRMHYGLTRRDRRLVRATNITDLRRALEDSRRREIERMERDLGIGRKP